MIGVSIEKFDKKYGKKIERDLANRGGQTEITDASNPSTTATSAESLSNVSIPHSGQVVKKKNPTNSEIGVRSVSTMISLILLIFLHIQNSHP